MIRPFVRAAFPLTFLAASGCGGFLPPAGFDSGVTGVVLAGPTCPVVNPNSGTDCADQPIVATIIVRDADIGLEVTRFASGTDGTFLVPLFPGRYVLDPQPVSGYIGTPPSQTVDVQAGQFTDVVIEYDTGIRQAGFLKLAWLVASPP